MNQVCVKAENLSKRFLILQSKDTAFKFIRAFLSDGCLKKEFWALKDISFEIRKGEKVALIGKNGSGKTTLLRVISGIYKNTSGVIETKEIPHLLFSLWSGLMWDLSVIDNIYLFGALHGMPRAFIKERLTQIIEMSGLTRFCYSPLKDLSTGQIQRLTLSAFFLVSADFLILDESLTFVDQGFTQKCEKYFSEIHSSAKTVIIASHDASFLKKYCNRALWLEDGRLRMDGKIDEVIAAYEQNAG
jgi:ABC-2 type transport system ATP-binding protein